MNIFLELKNWQLFGLVIGIPMIFDFALSSSMLSPDIPEEIFVAYFIMMIVFTGVLFGWFYALGTNLSKKVSGTAKTDLTKFKLLLFIPTGYMLFSFIHTISLISEISRGLKPDLGFSAFTLSLYLVSIFCVLYCVNFIAKALKSVELKRPVNFNDYVNDFFLMLLFPIGLWFVQPRINKLFDKNLLTK